MALTAGTSARAHRLIGLAAALLLAVTTALAFGRVFLGPTATLRLLATAMAAAGVAVLLERHSLFLATVASAAGLAVAIGLFVFPETTWYGLPTVTTLRSAVDAAALVGEQARIQVAPAEPIAPLMLAAVVSLWAAIFSAHALAFRAGSPLLGLVPPVALLAFADTVLEQFVKPLYGVAFLGAALLVVFADGLARVQGWGPIWSSARRGVAVTAGRGARRLGLTALAAATLAPLLVPGFGSRAVIDFGTPSEDRVAIDPFVSVRSQLSRGDPVEILRVTTPRPNYVRLVSLPVFDGAGWWPDRDAVGVPIGPGEPLRQTTGPPGPAERVQIDVTANLDMPWLPTPYPARSVEVPDAAVRYDAEGGVVFLDDPLREGDSYTVSTTFLQPKAEELRTIFFPRPAPDDPYVGLPDGFPPEIRELAIAWTAGADNVFDRAYAIQEHLRSGVYHYDEDVNGGDGTQTILNFLTVTKRGFCQQFATSMAAMLRSIGIPSRVVVGFTAGTHDQVSGQYSITTARAHAWVEVRFPLAGWLPFEPTPGRANPVTLGYTTPTGACDGVGCPKGQGETIGSVQQAVGPGAAQQNRFEHDPRSGGPRGAVGGGPGFRSGDTSPIAARTALVLGVLLAAIAFLLMAPVRALRRRIRLRWASAEPRRLILTTYDLFTERAAGVGLGRGSGETLEEYRRKVTDTGYLSNGHLDRLTQLTTAAAYSDRPPDAADAERAVTAADTALREIRRAVGPTRWFVGLYRRP